MSVGLRDMIDSRFWMSLAVITVVGTVGSILFKYGTDAFGMLTFERLFQMRLSKMSLLALATLSVGVLMALLGGYALRDSLFAFEFLFHPAVFIALVMLFVSRFLIGIPLSVTGLGRLNALLTVLSIVSTAIASAIVFKEAFTLRMIAGFLLGAISVLLIGQA